MIKIEAITLEDAYTQAASKLECSVTQLEIEVIQAPSKGIFGLFSKKAIIVAVIDSELIKEAPVLKAKEEKKEEKKVEKRVENKTPAKVKSVKKEKQKKQTPPVQKKEKQKVFKNTIMPESFVSTQDEDEDYNDIDDEDYEEVLATPESREVKPFDSTGLAIQDIVKDIDKDVNTLFKLTCFSIDKIEVSAYDESTILIEFKGDDAALLIGKEGYRYKALSYMLFNWINTKYQVQLRLEIAEFLKNQEESVLRYLEGVHEGIKRDGRAQTKILDGVLVQIALKELRNTYSDKYVAIRTTRDGLKYIIVNDYHSN